MTQRYEIRLAGEGGQGLILAGMILSEAATLYDHKHAVQTQGYGSQMRGGISHSEVIVSTEPIDYPLIIQPDVLLALSQQAFEQYHLALKKNGLLIVDADRVTRVPNGAVIAIPITTLARETTGLALTANILSLGLIIGLAATHHEEIVSIAAVEQAIAARIPKAMVPTNLKALHVGLAQAAAWQNAAEGATPPSESRANSNDNLTGS